MRGLLEQWLLARWYGNAGVLLLLLPLEILYQLLVGIKRAMRSRRKPQVPLIVVGNITVGGTGKTPVVLTLAQALSCRGLRVGLLARGYGGQGPFPLLVTAQTDADACGDEPRVLAQRSGLPVAVAPNRNAALSCLLAHGSCDVVIADDGLQHYALSRTCEVVVMDGQRGQGNGHCLPVGPLREPLARLGSVDMIVVNGAGPVANALRVPHVPVSVLQLRAGLLRSVANPQRSLDIDRFRRRYGVEVHALAGIGNPQRFYDTLVALGFVLRAQSFPDHHAWRPADLADREGLPVLMTEKDAVKCQAFAGPDAWYLEIDGVLEEEFIERIMQKLALQPREAS